MTARDVRVTPWRRFCTTRRKREEGGAGRSEAKTLSAELRPHRLACAGCIFSLPKASAKAGALAARSSVTRMLEEVPLSPDERTAVEGDAEKLDGMLAKLADVPALDGRTPRQITAGAASTRV